MHILEADSIRLELGYKSILAGIYLKCETAKITGLLAGNGQGKSCLMSVIYGIVNCEKSIRIDNVAYQYPYKKIGLISFLPQFSFVPKSFSLKKIFNDFELDFAVFANRFSEFKSKYNSSIGSLSGGENRLVEIYIIVAKASHFALLDEPFTHLSPIQIEKVKELLFEAKEKMGLLITDHMYQHVMDLSEDVYVLKNGYTYLARNIEEVSKLGYMHL